MKKLIVFMFSLVLLASCSNEPCDFVRDAESSHNKLNKIFLDIIQDNTLKIQTPNGLMTVEQVINTVRSNTDLDDFDKDGEFRKAAAKGINQILTDNHRAKFLSNIEEIMDMHSEAIEQLRRIAYKFAKSDELNYCLIDVQNSSLISQIRMPALFKDKAFDEKWNTIMFQRASGKKFDPRNRLKKR